MSRRVTMGATSVMGGGGASHHSGVHQLSPKEAAMHQLLTLTGMTYPPAVTAEELADEPVIGGKRKKDVSTTTASPAGDGVDLTWGPPANLPPRAALPLTSRIAWVEVLNLDTIGLAVCHSTRRLFACCPGANEHPTVTGYFSSPWVPSVFVKPTSGTVNGSAVHRRTPVGAETLTLQRNVDATALHQKLDVVMGGVQKQMDLYCAAYFGGGGGVTAATANLTDASPISVASVFVGHNASVVEAGSKNKGLGGKASVAAGVSVHFNIHVVLRHKTATGAEWTSVHCVAVEESDSGARYLIGSQCSMALTSSAQKEKEGKEGESSMSTATVLQARAAYMSREAMQVVIESHAATGGDNDGNRKDRKNSGDRGDADPFPFMRTTEQHVETLIDLVQSAEQNHLLPSILRVQIPRCSTLMKGGAGAPPGKAPKSLAALVAQGAGGSTMTPKQAVMSCRKELQALAAARESKKGGGD